MIKLFKYEGYKITIEPQALLLKPFKVIWNRDKSENKTKALTELGYIYFFCDPRSDYQFLVDDEERHTAIITDEGLPKDWKPDKQLKIAMDFYCSFKSASILLLEDTRYTIANLRAYLRAMDFNETDDKGKPVHTLQSITSTIKQIPALAIELDSAEKAVTSVNVSSSKIRGSAEASILEEGFENM